MNQKIILLVSCVMLVLAIGCSSANREPILPTESTPNIEIPVPNIAQSDISRTLYGIWNINFDIANLSAEITPDRESMAHFNLTPYLPTPQIRINSFNPSTSILDVDVTINNQTVIVGYDVRLIIYTDAVGHKLTNFDSWTGLYDIAGGLPINPFKAYATDIANRRFDAKLSHTANLLIKLPGGNPNVRFAIDGSYPGNCDEPYEIKDFSHGFLTESADSIARIGVKVYDWQSNTNSVKLYAPQLTFNPLTSFNQVDATTWDGYVTNERGAGQGDYTCYIIANSSGTTVPLYTEVNVHVNR